LFPGSPRGDSAEMKATLANVASGGNSVFRNPENRPGSNFNSKKNSGENSASKNPENFVSKIRTRFFLPIQNGCDNFCAFCVTRLARGKSRSFDLKKILNAARAAEKNGAREIVLTGIDLAGWNFDGKKFSELLAEILNFTKSARVRISSIGPQHFSREFWQVFAEKRICPHLHFSAQSGSERILKKMNRPHGVAEILSGAAAAKKARPEIAISADFIVGFPGETADDFAATKNLIKKIEFAKLHIFPFSARPKTAAAKFENQIPAAEKKSRATILQKLGTNLRQKFFEKNVGKTREILVENCGTGLTENFIRVKIPGAAENEIRKVKLTAENIVDFAKKNLRRDGKIGENLAADFLRKKGFKILAENFCVRGGEIDLIAEKSGRIIFVEVKMRRSKKFGEIAESISPAKQKSLIFAAENWLEKNGKFGSDWQIDLVEIYAPRNFPPQISHLENAVNLW